jgi:hypothetical protein
VAAAFTNGADAAEFQRQPLCHFRANPRESGVADRAANDRAAVNAGQCHDWGNLWRSADFDDRPRRSKPALYPYAWDRWANNVAEGGHW